MTQFDLSYEGIGVKGSFDCQIINSRIRAVFTSGMETVDVPTLRNLFIDQIYPFINLKTLFDSIPFHVNIEEIIDDNMVFYVGHEIRFSGKELDITIEDMIDTKVINNINFRNCLSIYRRALQETSMSGFYCYMAIEAIRSHLGGRDWQKMHDVLGTSREQVDELIKRYADVVRHGDFANNPSTTGEERSKMISLCRDYLVKFAKHLKSQS